MVNIPSTQWSYDQKAIVCTIKCEKNHNNIAVEYFLPQGPFAMLPMKKKHMNIIWSEKTKLANQYLATEEKEFLLHLKERFGTWLGDISLVPNTTFSYPLSFHHAQKYHTHRVVLIGDSAHSIHPIAGQGLNMGIRDIAALYDVLKSSLEFKINIGNIENLKNYEEIRYTDNTILSLTCDGLNRLFSNKNPILKTSRRFGIKVIEKIPSLKKIFLSHAMGTFGIHIPELLKDIPIDNNYKK